MSNLTADPLLTNALAGLTAATNIVDSKGKLLGIYTPILEGDDEQYARAARLFDPQEIERRLREEGGKGVPFQEVMNRIRALEESRR